MRYGFAFLFREFIVILVCIQYVFIRSEYCSICKLNTSLWCSIHQQQRQNVLQLPKNLEKQRPAVGGK